MTEIMNRHFILLLLVFWLVDCSTVEPAATPTAIAFASEIQIAIATDDFAAGSPRIPFILYDGPQQVSDAGQVTLTAFDLSQDPPVRGWQGAATGYNDYEVPYWVAYPELPQAGIWGLSADITLSDGTATRAQFTIEVKEEAQTPDVGDEVSPSQNRTLATEPDIAKLTSGEDPIPAFYQMTVAEAVTGERPSVIVFSTPAFCQTDICAPVLRSAETVYDSLADEVNFIHLEIYKQFNPELVLADEVAEWSLSSEPWTFVLDDDGRVAARLGGPVSPRELTAALDPLLP